MTTNNAETLWVKHGDGPAIEIPTKRCRSVGDLVDGAIKTMKLEGSPRDFRLYANGGRIPLGSQKPLEHVVQEFNISKEKPLEAIKRPRRNVEPPVYGSMKFNARPDALEAYDSYMKCAEELQKINATSHLKRAVDMACEKERLPFVFLEGSSGTGKTQLAMTLQKESSQHSPQRPVYYFLGKNMGLQIQNIHKYFLEPSKLFVECYQKDLRNLSTATRDELVDEDLYVFGFIEKLLFENSYGTASTVCVERVNGIDLKDKIEKTWKKTSERPIVILDEIPDGVKKLYGGLGNMLELTLVRNGFLSVGIPLIIMGTNDVAEESFQTKNWCYVVQNNQQIIDTFKGKVSNFWHTILVHSRPSFANEAFRLLQETPDLDDRPDEVFALLFEKFSAAQNIKTNRNGKIGQALFTLSLPHCQEYLGGGTTWICCHFARLKMLDGKIMSMGTDGYTYGETEGWIMETVFPSPSEDILLHLMISGGNSYRAIYDNGRPRPWKAICLDLKEQARLEGACNLFRRNDAKEKTIELEADLTSAIFLASRKNGVRGIQVPDFFQNMAYELYRNMIDFGSFVMEGFELLEQFNNITIPFFSAPNVEWPEFIKNGNNWNLANFYRVSGDKKKDMYGIIAKEVKNGETKSEFIAGQVSYYPDGVDATTFRNMIAKIMPENKITVILANYLKENIYNTRNYEEFIEKQDLDDCKFLLLKIERQSAKLQEMHKFGVGRDRNSVPSRLCVVVETDPQ